MIPYEMLVQDYVLISFNIGGVVGKHHAAQQYSRL